MSEEQRGSDHVSKKTRMNNNNIIPPHWLEETVMANGIRQHFYRTGGEKPLLILLHGFSENGLCWSRVAKALEDDYDIIMVDARGHGLSSGPETGYSQDLLTQDVAGLIHELLIRSADHAVVAARAALQSGSRQGLQQPVLFGYSNGALTAAHVAAALPELVRAVILEDPPWGESSSQPPATTEGNEPWPGYTAWYNAWIAWHKTLRTQTPEERVASSHQFLPPGALDWPEEELLTHLEAQAQFNLDVLNFFPSVPALTPWRETVERIECPILRLTSNSERRSAVPSQEAQKIAATWRKGQHVAFEHASHFMHHEMQGEQFDDFIRVVKAFLHEE